MKKCPKILPKLLLREEKNKMLWKSAGVDKLFRLDNNLIYAQNNIIGRKILTGD